MALANWWTRAGAYAIDSVLISGIGFIATIPVLIRFQTRMLDLTRQLGNEFDRAPTASTSPDVGGYLRDYLDLVVPWFVWLSLATFAAWMVYGAVMLRWKGATLGKMALGISVRLREHPGRLPWPAILIRLLVQQGVLLTSVVPLLYLFLTWFTYLDHLYPLWDQQRQAIHDKAAKTNVVTQ